MTELKPGTIIKDRYNLVEFKGSGSFGEVWLAHDVILDSDVAIKIYISLDPRGVEEFKSEYITTKDISHPNLLTTTYFDVWEQRPFLVMKYCAKGSSSVLSGKLDEYALWQFIHDVAAGLNYLHNLPEPIIHQDIKPDNILIDDSGRYLITDFGISKKIRSTMRKQSKRAIGAGATAYMGPERFDSNPAPVKASDIWALGVSIHELATGELPFSGLGGGMQKNGAEMPFLGKKWSKDMTMVMQSCLAQNTWDRPTAQQLEEYSKSIIKGQIAEVTWNPSMDNANQTSNAILNQNEMSNDGSSENEKDVSSHKRKLWITICALSISIIFICILWQKNKLDKPTESPVVATEAVDTIAAKLEKGENEVADTVIVEQKQKNIDVHVTTNTSINKERPQKESVSPQVDNNASLLRKALAENDYQQVQKLANQGYAAAYGPLAKYYLSNHDYKTAELYAKKAKSAGFSDGSAVIKTLENLGYYD